MLIHISPPPPLSNTVPIHNFSKGSIVSSLFKQNKIENILQIYVYRNNSPANDFTYRYMDCGTSHTASNYTTSDIEDENIGYIKTFKNNWIPNFPDLALNFLCILETILEIVIVKEEGKHIL